MLLPLLYHYYHYYYHHSWKRLLFLRGTKISRIKEEMKKNHFFKQIVSPLLSISGFYSIITINQRTHKKILYGKTGVSWKSSPWRDTPRRTHGPAARQILPVPLHRRGLAQLEFCKQTHVLAQFFLKKEKNRIRLCLCSWPTRSTWSAPLRWTSSRPPGCRSRPRPHLRPPPPPRGGTGGNLSNKKRSTKEVY